MGCGSSAAVASSSLIRSQSLHRSAVKDAGSQTNVTVLIASTTNSRNEAHDARKEQIMLHRVEALARAKELSNSKSGYTTATYTESGMSTPRSAYSRTRKIRGSDGGSGSDVDRRSDGLGSNTNLSRTDLSTRSSSARKTQVSFRNDEYKRIATSHNKRRKSYMNRAKTSINKINGRKVHAANSEHSGSSGTNSINKQADTGYDGSVSSVPSSSTLINGTSKQNNSLPDGNNGSPGYDVIKTVSNETRVDKEMLSTVVSVDEQSIVRENSKDIDLLVNVNPQKQDNEISLETHKSDESVNNTSSESATTNNSPVEHKISGVVTDHKSEHQLSNLSITKNTELDHQHNKSALPLSESSPVNSLSDENKVCLNHDSDNSDTNNAEVDLNYNNVDDSSSVVVVGDSTNIKSISNLNTEESISHLTMVG